LSRNKGGRGEVCPSHSFKRVLIIFKGTSNIAGSSQVVVKKIHTKGEIGGKRGKFTKATFFNRFRQFLDYMSINHPSSAAVNKKFMDWKLGGWSE